MRRVALLLLPLFASGCDAWPTVVRNDAGGEITFRYHQKDESSWSGPQPIAAGKAIRLAREHWIQDIDGVEVREGEKRYSYALKDILPFRDSCKSSGLARRAKVAPDCFLIYLGDGRFTVTTKPGR